MNGDGGDAAIVVAPRELGCVEDVGEFGLPVAPPAAECAEVLWGFEVFEEDAAFGMEAET